ncbi:MAG: endo-1,4-beta-xylanase [Tannerella sp.]|jgi:endo-1,4-beta-xylanase|nr:endo-1,4-beta-xylanase [Tannerella sp.]
MKKHFLLTAIVLCTSGLSGCTSGNNRTGERELSLKEAFGDKFYIGAALNTGQIMERDVDAVRVIREHFSAIVPENCMKSMYLQPKEGEFSFDEADRFVEFGRKYGLFVTGHTLVWHSQAPDWFFTDGGGNDVSRDVLTERMKSHISTVVGRYRGVIRGWDVVNEAVLDDGSLRNSKFLQIIGPDYIRLAFEFAREADPDAELYYNDYSMAVPAKRQGVVRLVKSLQEQGVRIDGIGMQGHLNMHFPPLEEFETSLLAFSELGVSVMITELDLSVLPSPRENAGADVAQSFEYRKEINPYAGGLPEDVEAAWNSRYADFFNLFLKHRDRITRVTLWGVGDADSWKNNWPVPGRTDYALLFDRNYEAKPLVDILTKNAQK